MALRSDAVLQRPVLLPSLAQFWHRSEVALTKIVATRVRNGYECTHVLLLREIWYANHRKVLRLYQEEGMNLRTKRP